MREHFFHENKKLADENLRVIEKTAIDQRVARIYPTHNGPVLTSELTKYIKDEPLLRLLTKQETDMLRDAHLHDIKTAGESISEEDFRIVSADDHMAVMTYIESIKTGLAETKKVLQTVLYSKVSNAWIPLYRIHRPSKGTPPSIILYYCILNKIVR